MVLKMRLLTATCLAMLAASLAGCSSDPADENAAKPVASIQTAIAASGSVAQTVPLYGIAEPASGAETAITVPAEARLTHLLVTNGMHVDAGQTIATMSASPASQLEAAKAGVDAATSAAALARTKRLRADGLASDADLEAAQSAAHAAALTRDNLAARIGKLTLRAPLRGNVEGLTAHEGDLVPMGTTLARVVSGNRLRARFGISPALARSLHAGMPLAIMQRTRDTRLMTTVQSVDPVIDPATRQASLIALLPAGNAVSPGEIVEASVDIAGADSGVTVPYAALIDEGGESFVYVIENGVAHRRPVTVAQATDTMLAITKGLKSGERVAISGGTALDEGMKVHDTSHDTSKDSHK